MPIQLKEDLIVELVPMHKYGITTVLLFSKYASPIFAQRKPTETNVSLWISGKSTVLLRMTITTTFIQLALCQTQHNIWQESFFFCKLDCSQAYHCMQMADQWSLEMFAFRFGGRTFAYKRVAQGLSRSVSAFSSFMRDYLGPVVKVDQCAQYVDDIGIAANNAKDLTRNIRAVFKCIGQAGLKLTFENCHFGSRQVDMLGGTISPEETSTKA